MEIKLGNVHLERTSAGLAILNDRISFVELDEDSNVIQKINILLPEGCVANGQIRNFSQLENAFEQLYQSVGKIKEPITIGLPAGECMISLLNFPKMEIEDVKGTMDLNFEEYFHVPRQERVFDLIQIKTHADNRERTDMTILAAHARKNTVEQILDAMWKAGLPAGAIEPSNFAMLRAIPECQEDFSIFANPLNVIAVYEGIGIYFRTSSSTNAVQDILNTTQYIESHNRGVRVEKIIVAGLNIQVDENQDSTIKFTKVEDEFYVAEGLALRTLEGVKVLDLRPMEFVELEQRRYHFNVYRLILWSLVVAFIMLSIGTISFAYSCIQNLSYEMDVMRENVDDMTRQRMEIAAENARLEKQKNKIGTVLDFLKSDLPVLEVLRALETAVAIVNNEGYELKFDNAEFVKGAGESVIININGKANNNTAISIMTDELRNGFNQSEVDLEAIKDTDMKEKIQNSIEQQKRDGYKIFSNVSVPVSEKDTLGRVVFKLILVVGEAKNNG